MNEITETINLLADTSSTKAKKEILVERDSKLLRKVLVQAHNHFITFGISKIDLTGVEFADEHPTSWWLDLFTLLDTLADRELTGHAARDAIIALASQTTEEDAQLLLNILKKDLRTGTGVRLINKAFPGLLPEAFCMGATKYNPDKAEFPVYADTKLDGVRCIATVAENVHLYSRNGKEFKNYGIVEKELALLDLEPDVHLDGEITMGHFQDLMKTMGNREEGIELAKDAIYNIFDLQITTLPFRDRLILLASIQHNIKSLGLKHVRVIIGMFIETEAMLKVFYEQQLEDGEEGAMIKTLTGEYEFKRSKAWQKMKPEHTEDIEIIDFEEGRGKYEGQLGAFICKLNGVDGEVRVGSGLKDEQRQELWDRREELVHTYIEVKYQEKTRDGSLRFPIFIKFRPDKS